MLRDQFGDHSERYAFHTFEPFHRLKVIKRTDRLTLPGKELLCQCKNIEKNLQYNMSIQTMSNKLCTIDDLLKSNLNWLTAELFKKKCMIKFGINKITIFSEF